MTIREFSEQAFSEALRLHCDAAETYYAEADSFSANASGGEIERYEVSRQAGLSLRVTAAGREGYAYTESLDDPAELVRRAMDNAAVTDSPDPHPMQGKSEYRAVEEAGAALMQVPEAERIALALQLEREALAADPRVQRAVYSELACGSGRVEIRNTRGLDAVRTMGQQICYVMPLMQQGEEVRTGLAFRMGAEADDVSGCAKEAVEETAGKFGAAPVASGTYRVILRNTAMADLLEAFSGIFSAEEAQSGRSLLAGREGDTIAAACITVTDDPFHPAAPRPFDDEGTPAYRKEIVDRGVLKTLLHNLKTAEKAGVRTTANALRASAASPVDVGPSVCLIEPGAESMDALMQKLGTGLIVTELDGLHAGVDAVSGDFSLKSTGWLVENGEAVRPVTEITVAGNFLTMLSSVEAVGADLRFTMPGAALFGSPSLLVRELSVAGK